MNKMPYKIINQRGQIQILEEQLWLNGNILIISVPIPIWANPILVPFPLVLTIWFPFPWKSRRRDRNSAFPIPMHISSLDTSVCNYVSKLFFQCNGIHIRPIHGHMHNKSIEIQFKIMTESLTDAVFTSNYIRAYIVIVIC